MTAIDPAPFDIGTAELPYPGQMRSGDRYVVRKLRQGLMVAVIDGVGHGDEAASAADLAAAEMRAPISEASVIGVVQRCHEALRPTRGAVMGLAFLDPANEEITWLGVGNVAGALLRGKHALDHHDEALLQRAGVVGRQLPPLRAEIVAITGGDIVVLATDGIDPDFVESARKDGSSQAIADSILASHFRGTDDAMVVVIRYKGRVPDA